MTMKKIYCSPVTTLIVFEAEEKLLVISAETTNPVEGGDPPHQEVMVLLPTHLLVLVMQNDRFGTMMTRKWKVNNKQRTNLSYE